MRRHRRFSFGIVRVALALSALVWPSYSAFAQTPVESSAEARFQLDVHVPDAAIAAMLPMGFTLNVATQGAAKDANLRVVFIDRVTINAPDGKPVGKTGSNRLVYLIAPVKDPAGANAQLVIGGLTEDPADAPGPFGVYKAATTHQMQRSTSSSGISPILIAGGSFAASGEHMEPHYQSTSGGPTEPTHRNEITGEEPGLLSDLER
jgi:hypothetical protein